MAISLARRVLTRMAVGWSLVLAILFVPAGTVLWPAALVYAGIMMGFMAFFVLRSLRNDPELLERRLELREKERSQRLIMGLSLPFYLCAFILPGLDFRFGWSSLPLAAVAAGDLLTVAGYLLFLRVMKENSWAGRTVETSAEQRVISSGPYAVVRHPMYVAVILLYLAGPLALGSPWAYIPVAPIAAAIVLRIGNEEAVLLRELPGYGDYMNAVRWRLVPHIW